MTSTLNFTFPFQAIFTGPDVWTDFDIEAHLVSSEYSPSMSHFATDIQDYIVSSSKLSSKSCKYDIERKKFVCDAADTTFSLVSGPKIEYIALTRWPYLIGVLEGKVIPNGGDVNLQWPDTGIFLYKFSRDIETKHAIFYETKYYI